MVITLNQINRWTRVIILLALLSACSKPAVEEYLPKLTLTGLDGIQTSTDAFRGKLLVLNVWATWCPPCRREMPSLEQLSKSADGKRIVVAGITIDNSKNAVEEFITQHGITFRNFMDTSGNISNKLGVLIYPGTLLVAPDGKIVQKITGEQDWNSPAMLRVLEDAYQGKINDSDLNQAVLPYNRKR